MLEVLGPIIGANFAEQVIYLLDLDLKLIDYRKGEGKERNNGDEGDYEEAKEVGAYPVKEQVGERMLGDGKLRLLKVLNDVIEPVGNDLI